MKTRAIFPNHFPHSGRLAASHVSAIIVALKVGVRRTRGEAALVPVTEFSDHLHPCRRTAPPGSDRDGDYRETRRLLVAIDRRVPVIPLAVV